MGNSEQKIIRNDIEAIAKPKFFQDILKLIDSWYIIVHWPLDNDAQKIINISGKINCNNRTLPYSEQQKSIIINRGC